MRHCLPRSSLVVSALFALVFACGSIPAAAQRQTPDGRLTVESIFGEPNFQPPLAGGIEWSPDGRTLSYFQDTDAGKELWALDAATGRSRQLIGAEKLGDLLQPWPATWLQRTGFGRRAPKLYLWSPTGDALLLRSASKLVWYDLKNGRSRSLVAGSERLTDPKIAPDGRWSASSAITIYGSSTSARAASASSRATEAKPCATAKSTGSIRKN